MSGSVLVSSNLGRAGGGTPGGFGPSVAARRNERGMARRIQRPSTTTSRHATASSCVSVDGPRRSAAAAHLSRATPPASWTFAFSGGSVASWWQVRAVRSSALGLLLGLQDALDHGVQALLELVLAHPLHAAQQAQALLDPRLAVELAVRVLDGHRGQQLDELGLGDLLAQGADQHGAHELAARVAGGVVAVVDLEAELAGRAGDVDDEGRVGAGCGGRRAVLVEERAEAEGGVAVALVVERVALEDQNADAQAGGAVVVHVHLVPS